MSDSYGIDIAIDNNNELIMSGIDFKTVSGIDCAVQQVKVRMQTPKGSLFYDLNYGSEIYKFVQAPYTKKQLDYFVSMVKDCLKAEPLIDNDSIVIVTEGYSINSFVCKASWKFYGTDNELNLVISADKELTIWSE